jgi:hypothetical protein
MSKRRMGGGGSRGKERGPHKGVRGEIEKNGGEIESPEDRGKIGFDDPVFMAPKAPVGMYGGGMAKKGYAMGGPMKKKGYAMGGPMKKKGYKKGGKVRGAGIAKKGVRPCKMR